MGFFDFFSAEKAKESRSQGSYGAMTGCPNSNTAKKHDLIGRVLTHLKKQGAKPWATFSPDNQARVTAKKVVLNKCLEVLNNDRSSGDLTSYLYHAKQQPNNYTQADGRFYKTSDTAGLVDEVVAFVCDPMKFEDLAQPLVYSLP